MITTVAYFIEFWTSDYGWVRDGQSYRYENVARRECEEQNRAYPDKIEPNRVVRVTTTIERLHELR